MPMVVGEPVPLSLHGAIESQMNRYGWAEPKHVSISVEQRVPLKPVAISVYGPCVVPARR